MDEDWFHENYIKIVERNWSLIEWNYYTKVIRLALYHRIWMRDGIEGAVFTRIWTSTFTLEDEVRLAGEAIATLSPHE